MTTVSKCEIVIAPDRVTTNVRMEITNVGTGQFDFRATVVNELRMKFLGNDCGDLPPEAAGDDAQVGSGESES